jgi:hypothetical protein
VLGSEAVVLVIQGTNSYLACLNVELLGTSCLAVNELVPSLTKSTALEEFKSSGSQNFAAFST